MTVLEMHDYFKVLVDKEDSLNYPNFEAEHIDFFLNDTGQDILVKQRYSGRPDAFGHSFEETQKRTDDLRILVTNSVISNGVNNEDNKPNSRFFTLPTNYWFAIGEEAVVEYTDCNGQSTTKTVRVKPISHDDYSKVIRDPFARPTQDEILRLMYQDKAELIGPADATIDSYVLRYIRKPARISLATSTDCELSDHLHLDVVQFAVTAAIRSTQNDNEYAKMLRELNRQE